MSNYAAVACDVGNAVTCFRAAEISVTIWIVAGVLGVSHRGKLRMKIRVKFTKPHTEAILTQGRLWWKRHALVELRGHYWHYVVSDKDVDGYIKQLLMKAATEEANKQHETRVWQKTTSFPKAYLVDKR